MKVVVERSGVARADDEADEEVAPRENPFEPNAVWYWPVAVFLCLLALAVVWVPAFVPGQDTPVHAFFARVSVSDLHSLLLIRSLQYPP